MDHMLCPSRVTYAPSASSSSAARCTQTNRDMRRWGTEDQSETLNVLSVYKHPQQPLNETGVLLPKEEHFKRSKHWQTLETLWGKYQMLREKYRMRTDSPHAYHTWPQDLGGRFTRTAYRTVLERLQRQFSPTTRAITHAKWCRDLARANDATAEVTRGGAAHHKPSVGHGLVLRYSCQHTGGVGSPMLNAQGRRQRFAPLCRWAAPVVIFNDNCVS